MKHPVLNTSSWSFLAGLHCVLLFLLDDHWAERHDGTFINMATPDFIV